MPHQEQDENNSSDIWVCLTVGFRQNQLNLICKINILANCRNQWNDFVPMWGSRLHLQCVEESFHANYSAQVTFKGTLGEFRNFWQYCTNYIMSI